MTFIFWSDLILNFLCLVILDFVVFDHRDKHSSGSVTLDEFKYIFQLGYQLLACITDLDLIQNPFMEAVKDPGTLYGSKAEWDMTSQLYGVEVGAQEASVELSSVSKSLSSCSDVLKFFQIFQQGRINALEF